MAPWIFFLFVGVLDFGFFAYAAIATQNAARVAALYTSSGSSVAADAAGACLAVLEELRWLPNVKNGQVTNCNNATVSLTAQAVTGADGAPASRVTLSYKTIPMIPIPGILAHQFTFTRTVEMRLRD
jgi:Flp pilus assembly protein TadG